MVSQRSPGRLRRPGFVCERTPDAALLRPQAAYAIIQPMLEDVFDAQLFHLRQEPQLMAQVRQLP